MHLCQISALAGLVYRKPEHRLIAVAAGALLGVSALASLGALYQLIAQVSGLAIALCGGVNAIAVGAVLPLPMWWLMTREKSAMRRKLACMRPRESSPRRAASSSAW